jgi:ribokinase
VEAARTTPTPRVCVVGAANVDLVSYVPRLPRVGETLHGSRFEIGDGGKGANQAVMAAKLGADVALVAKLGDDLFGQPMLERLRAHGVDTTHVSVTSDAPSGVAPIAVDEEGRNTIVIVTGANDLLGPADVERARPAIAKAAVVVCQLEIPVETTLAALRVARGEGVRTILNPAPARPDLSQEAYGLSDVFCPNETEAADLAGRPLRELEEIVAAAREFRQLGSGAVVVTLGERGCVVVDDEATPIPAPVVRAVDTTGAGDAFVGTLACMLAVGGDLHDAAGVATKIASLSVQRPGTQSSFPQIDQLPAGLGPFPMRV